MRPQSKRKCDPWTKSRCNPGRIFRCDFCWARSRSWSGLFSSAHGDDISYIFGILSTGGRPPTYGEGAPAPVDHASAVVDKCSSSRILSAFYNILSGTLDATRMQITRTSLSPAMFAKRIPTTHLISRSSRWRYHLNDLSRIRQGCFAVTAIKIAAIQQLYE